MARRVGGERGLTLLELVLASALLAILATAAMPLYEMTVRREREVELRRSLREIRRALDAFNKSYVASGGAVMGEQKGQSTPTPTPTPSPTGSPGPAPKGGANGDVPLIDVSQFDPVDCKGYPPDLLRLMEGVQAYGGSTDDKDFVKFVRRIPIDPMLNRDLLDSNDKNFGWGACCYQDEPNCKVWCRKNVWDVHSRSHALSLDGKTRYDEW